MKILRKIICLLLLLPGAASAELLHASATDEITIVNSNDVYELMADMKHVNPTSGDWMVLFSCSVSGNDVSDNIFAAIFKNGTIIEASKRRFTVENSLDTDDDYMLAITYQVNVNGSEDIEVRWKYTAPTSIGKTHERNLTMMSAPSGDFDQVTSTTPDTTSSTSYTVITGMTITPGADDYVAFFTSNWFNSTAAGGEDFSFAVFVGGTIVQHTERSVTGEGSWGGSPVAYSQIAIFAKVSPTGGQAVDVRWIRTGGTGSITVDDRALTLLRRDAADISEFSSTVACSTTSTSDIQVCNATLTPGAGDWIGCFSTSFGHTASISVLHPHEFSFYVNDVRVADTVRDQDTNDSFDGEMRQVALTMGKLSPTAGQTVKAQWIASQSTERTALEITMVLFKESDAAAARRKTIIQ